MLVKTLCGIMSTIIRALRKSRKDGIQETLFEAIDILYRRKILMHQSKKLISQTSILTRQELRNQPKYISHYHELSESNDKPVPRKRSISPNVPIEKVEPDDYGPHFVSIINDTTVLGPAGIGRTSEGSLIADTVARPHDAEHRLANGVSRSMKLFSPHKVQREIKKPGHVESSKKFNLVCPLIQMWGKNYYHWTAETLTKLRGVEYLREHYDIEPTLLIPIDTSPWMLESLKLLGYDRSNLVKLSDFVVSVDKLVVPSYPGPNDFALRWLRSRMVSATATTEPPDASKRLFVVRQDATRRRIKNMEVVAETLQQWGFEMIDPGNHSVAEQVQIFNNAEIVIGTHGAGLTNIIYSNDITIIELFGQRKRTTFYRIAKLLDHSYTCIENDQKGVDIKVDLPKLDATIDKITTNK